MFFLSYGHSIFSPHVFLYLSVMLIAFNLVILCLHALQTELQNQIAYYNFPSCDTITQEHFEVRGLSRCQETLIASCSQRAKIKDPTPVLLPGKSHGRRSLGGCSPWGH